LLRLVWQRFLPFRVLLLADGDQGQLQLARWLPLLSIMRHKQRRTTAHICENHICILRTADPEIMARLLDSNK